MACQSGLTSDLGCAACGRAECEAPRVAAQVQQALPCREGADECPAVALVRVEARLLAVPQVHLEADAVLLDPDV